MGREDLSPMAQHDFSRDVAFPRMARIQPFPYRVGTLAEYAPVAWDQRGGRTLRTRGRLGARATLGLPQGNLRAAPG